MFLSIIISFFFFFQKKKNENLKFFLKKFRKFFFFFRFSFHFTLSCLCFFSMNGVERGLTVSRDDHPVELVPAPDIILSGPRVNSVVHGHIPYWVGQLPFLKDRRENIGGPGAIRFSTGDGPLEFRETSARLITDGHRVIGGQAKGGGGLLQNFRES